MRCFFCNSQKSPWSLFIACARRQLLFLSAFTKKRTQLTSVNSFFIIKLINQLSSVGDSHFTLKCRSRFQENFTCWLLDTVTWLASNLLMSLSSGNFNRSFTVRSYPVCSCCFSLFVSARSLPGVRLSNCPYTCDKILIFLNVKLNKIWTDNACIRFAKMSPPYWLVARKSLSTLFYSVLIVNNRLVRFNFHFV